jgi:membrane protease YdiL (CAAX protease family)
VWQTLCVGWGLLLEIFGVHLEEQDVLQQFRAAVAVGDQRQLLLFGLTAIVLAPVTEEIIFRGAFFGGLAARWGFLPAALSSSLVFGGVHFSLSALFPLFLVGMILCYLYKRTGSIYPSMIYHAIFNGVTLLIVLLPESAD